jgi:hypothetical protein
VDGAALGWDVTFAASNALLAGMTPGVSQRLRGGQFGDGFARGAVAGAVAYVGRRMGAEQFDGAGLLGRQVSAVTDPGAVPSRPPDLAHWHLELTSHPGFRISRAGTGDIPATFQAPAYWLVWAAGEPVVAWFSVRRQWDGEASGAAYWWRLQVASDIQWILVWE